MHDYQILKLWKVQVFFHILLFIVGIFNLSLSVVYCCQTDTWAWALSLSTNQRQGSVTADQSEFDKSWWPTAVVVTKSRNDGSFLIILFLGGTKITTLVKIIKSIIKISKIHAYMHHYPIMNLCQRGFLILFPSYEAHFRFLF